MSKDNLANDPLRLTLQKLIKHAGVDFTPDEVVHEFLSVKEKRSNQRLLKILEVISRDQPNVNDYLLEAAMLMQKKDPIYCLMNFLKNYSNVPLTAPNRNNEFQTSTPLVAKKSVDSIVTPDNLMEIKERVVQAASKGVLRRAYTASNPPSCNNSNTSIPLTSSCYNFPSSSCVFPNSQKNRTDALWDFHNIEGLKLQYNNIKAIPIITQENLLLHDLLYCLIGMRGSYIIPCNTTNLILTAQASSYGASSNINSTNLWFDISDQIHSSLRDITHKILPLAVYYITIQRFIQRVSNSPDCGQVLQAFGEALRSIVHDYYSLLTQLESELIAENLTLHKLVFYIRPTLNTMEVLAGAINDIEMYNLSSAQVLTLLCEKISSLTGDEDSQKFMIQLTQLAAVPYMSILQLWIQKGVIDDPQHEFLVEDNEVIRREELPEHYSADYWEKRYTLRRDRIPCFLERVLDIILRIGKYLNVIRQCGKKVTPPQTMNLQFSANNQAHIDVIQKAYRFASKNLLEVLLKENDLMGHLNSVKRYFFLYQGDFIEQFMDSCEEELSKNVDKVLPMKLENLVGLTQRLSAAKNDPYKDELHCELLTYDLVTQMSKIMNNTEEEYWQPHDRLDLNGLECFAFRYEVKWPVSLVLNHIAISKYQMLFRLLFYCKHVERQLCRVWKANSITRKFSQHDAELYRSAFTLRQRMMNAIQNLEYYMMVEVIEPNWHTFILNMNKVENVDEVLEFHQDFLDSCLRNCMLTETAQLNRSIFKLCNICIKFCEFIEKSQRFFLDAELKSMMCDSNDEDNSDSEIERSSQKQSETSLAPTDTFSERVKRYDLEFTGQLIGLLNQITAVATEHPSDRFMNLVHRINFNSFYDEQMDKLCAKDSMLSHI